MRLKKRGPPKKLDDPAKKDNDPTAKRKGGIMDLARYRELLDEQAPELIKLKREAINEIIRTLEDSGLVMEILEIKTSVQEIWTFGVSYRRKHYPTLELALNPMCPELSLTLIEASGKEFGKLIFTYDESGDQVLKVDHNTTRADLAHTLRQFAEERVARRLHRERFLDAVRHITGQYFFCLVPVNPGQT